MKSKNYSVLLVDDIADMRELIAYELESLGVQVFHASSGEEAFRIYESHPIDFIVSDVNMPNGNGIHLIRKINNRKLELPPTVLMTGFSTLTDEDAAKLGVIRIFENLLDLAEIKNLVQEHMMKKSAFIAGRKPYLSKAS